MAKPVFEITYQLSEAEFSTAHRLHLRRTLLNFKNFALITLALGLASLQAQVLGPMNWATRVFMVLWVAIVLLMAWAFWRLPARLYQRKPSLRGIFKLDVDQDGIRLHTEGHDAREPASEWLDWTSLSRTSEGKGFFLFYFDSTLPLVIPKRAFPSPEHEEDFRKFVSERIFSPSAQ